MFRARLCSQEQGKSNSLWAEDWEDILCLLDCSDIWKEKTSFSFGNLLDYYLWKIKPFSFLFHLYFLWVTSFIATMKIFISCCLPGITDPKSFCERLEENILDQMENAHMNDCLDLACKDVKIWNAELLYLTSQMLNLSDFKSSF